jgi:hypothetical protein
MPRPLRHQSFQVHRTQSSYHIRRYTVQTATFVTVSLNNASFSCSIALAPFHANRESVLINFEVLTAVKMSMMVFWIVTPCGLVGSLYSNVSEEHTPWRWRRYVSPKRWYPPTSLHGVTIQDTDIEFSVTVLLRLCTKLWLFCASFLRVLGDHVPYRFHGIQLNRFHLVFERRFLLKKDLIKESLPLSVVARQGMNFRAAGLANYGYWYLMLNLLVIKVIAVLV